MINQGKINSKKSGAFGANLFVFIVMLLWIVNDFIPISIKDAISRLGLERTLISFTICQIVFLLIPTIAYFKISKKSFKKVLRLNKIGIKTLIITLVILLLYEPIGMFVSSLSMYIFPSEHIVIQNSLRGIPLFEKIFIVALIPAIFEEITIRGVVLFGYNGISIGKAAVITGFFFGALHRNGNQFSYTFIMGIILVYIVRITNSIIPAMICHFINNSISTVIGYYFPKASMKTNHVPMIDMGALAFWVIIVGVLIMSIILLMIELEKINNYSDIKKVDEFKKSNNIEGEIKIVNWPFVGIVIMGAFSIGFQLVMLYVVK